FRDDGQSIGNAIPMDVAPKFFNKVTGGVSQAVSSRAAKAVVSKIAAKGKKIIEAIVRKTPQETKKDEGYIQKSDIVRYPDGIRSIDPDDTIRDESRHDVSITIEDLLKVAKNTGFLNLGDASGLKKTLDEHESLIRAGLILELFDPKGLPLASAKRDKFGRIVFNRTFKIDSERIGIGVCGETIGEAYEKSEAKEKEWIYEWGHREKKVFNKEAFVDIIKGNEKFYDTKFTHLSSADPFTLSVSSTGIITRPLQIGVSIDGIPILTAYVSSEDLFIDDKMVIPENLREEIRRAFENRDLSKQKSLMEKVTKKVEESLPDGSNSDVSLRAATENGDIAVVLHKGENDEVTGLLSVLDKTYYTKNGNECLITSTAPINSTKDLASQYKAFDDLVYGTLDRLGLDATGEEIFSALVSALQGAVYDNIGYAFEIKFEKLSLSISIQPNGDILYNYIDNLRSNISPYTPQAKTSYPVTPQQAKVIIDNLMTINPIAQALPAPNVITPEQVGAIPKQIRNALNASPGFVASFGDTYVIELTGENIAVGVKCTRSGFTNVGIAGLKPSVFDDGMIIMPVMTQGPQAVTAIYGTENITGIKAIIQAIRSPAKESALGRLARAIDNLRDKLPSTQIVVPLTIPSSIDAQGRRTPTKTLVLSSMGDYGAAMQASGIKSHGKEYGMRTSLDNASFYLQLSFLNEVIIPAAEKHNLATLDGQKAFNGDVLEGVEAIIRDFERDMGSEEIDSKRYTADNRQEDIIEEEVRNYGSYVTPSPVQEEVEKSLMEGAQLPSTPIIQPLLGADSKDPSATTKEGKQEDARPLFDVQYYDSSVSNPEIGYIVSRGFKISVDGKFLHTLRVQGPEGVVAGFDIDTDGAEMTEEIYQKVTQLIRDTMIMPNAGSVEAAAFIDRADKLELLNVISGVMISNLRGESLIIQRLSERRYLTTGPEVNVMSVLDGDKLRQFDYQDKDQTLNELLTPHEGKPTTLRTAERTKTENMGQFGETVRVYDVQPVGKPDSVARKAMEALLGILKLPDATVQFGVEAPQKTAITKIINGNHEVVAYEDAEKIYFWGRKTDTGEVEIISIPGNIRVLYDLKGGTTTKLLSNVSPENAGSLLRALKGVPNIAFDLPNILHAKNAAEVVGPEAQQAVDFVGNAGEDMGGTYGEAGIKGINLGSLRYTIGTNDKGEPYVHIYAPVTSNNLASGLDTDYGKLIRGAENLKMEPLMFEINVKDGKAEFAPAPTEKQLALLEAKDLIPKVMVAKEGALRRINAKDLTRENDSKIPADQRSFVNVMKEKTPNAGLAFDSEGNFVMYLFNRKELAILVKETNLPKGFLEQATSLMKVPVSVADTFRFRSLDEGGMEALVPIAANNITDE
ncbi:MAG: hypothetical protein HQ579_05940, partial [Candidatus Omnitrophica bacterium]|nr:hypothetical protein [Candidatus Omnitrophota bacterium]